MILLGIDLLLLVVADFPPRIISAIKAVSGFGILTIMAQILMEIRSKPEQQQSAFQARVSSINNSTQMESFEMKVVTQLIATPDEIAQALTDENHRMQWDLRAQKVTKLSTTDKEDVVRIEYDNQSTELSKFTFIAASPSQSDVDGNLSQQQYYIQEHVNADFYRYYVLEPVENRMYMMRVTMYTKVTPQAFEKHGKEVYRKLATLRSYISQLNRSSAV